MIADGALGLVMGFGMLVLTSSGHSKRAFEAIDLAVMGFLLLAILAVYLYKLMSDLGKEEKVVQTTLQLTKIEIAER